MVPAYRQSPRQVTMNLLANVSRRVVAAAALASAAILLPAAALAAPARTTAAAASALRPCRETGLQITPGSRTG